MKISRGLTFFSTLLWMAVFAAGQDVHYNYDRGTNFASYKTYQWVELPSGVPDQLIDQSIRRALDEQLVQKGLTRVEKNGDLQVRYRVVVREEKGMRLFRSNIGPNIGPGWAGDSTITGETSTIGVGTLIVDLEDPARNQLIWRGDASKTIDLKKDPEKNYKNLQKAIAKLFKNYPPAAKN
jgi:Domain of unknown function (DUF4136)